MWCRTPRGNLVGKKAGGEPKGPHKTPRWHTMPQLPRLRDPPAGPRHWSREMIITVSGLHGTGKSTYAAHLAKALGYRHLSAGLLFRKLAKEKGLSLEEFGELALKDPGIDRIVDNETMKEAEKGNVVVDGQLAGWVLKEIADLRIYLTAPDNVRLERIAKRDQMGMEEARKQTRLRETVQSERYRKHYGLRVEDRSIYHLTIDTNLLTMEETAKILLTAAKAVEAKQHGNENKETLNR